MPTSVTVNDLKINELTEAQYDAAVQGGVIGENELSVITDMTDKAVQVSTMPTASATELGNIYQFTGTTDANYTNGYFYKCVSDGQEPATYSWTQVDVQPSSGGSSYTAGTGISIDANNEISVTDPVLVNLGSASNQELNVGGSPQSAGYRSVVVGPNARSNAGYSTVLGANALSNSFNCVAIGYGARCNNTGAIMISAQNTRFVQNSDANTFKVSNANGDFEIMSADGTIPAARHATLPTADGTYVLKLVITDGTPTLQWVAE